MVREGTGPLETKWVTIRKEMYCASARCQSCESAVDPATRLLGLGDYLRTYAHACSLRDRVM